MEIYYKFNMVFYKFKHYWIKNLLQGIRVLIFTFRDCTKLGNLFNIVNVCLINDCLCLNAGITFKVRSSFYGFYF